MWDGPGPGPGPRRRGGPHFRDHHEDYGGRDRPMHNYRGRGGMNMGPMGPRHFDMPPMNMRRMDGPPMRGHDLDPRAMGGPGGRDFFRHGEEPGFDTGRHPENFKERFAYTPGFGEHGRNPDDMDGRNMPPHESGGRFRDMDGEDFQFERSPFHGEGRRGFHSDRMDRNDRFREGRDRSPMGLRHSEGFEMDMPPHERRRKEFGRGRGGSPFNPRGGFDSDMDFRNRPGPMSDFRGRGQSSRFGNESIPPVDQRGPELAPDASDPQMAEEATIDHEGDSPLTDYRCGEEMTLAEEWKNRNKDKKPLLLISKGFASTNEPNYPMDFGRDENIRDSLHFKERDKMPLDYQPKDLKFPCRNNFPTMDLPGRKASPDFMPPINDPLGRERENAPWLENRDLKYRQPPPTILKTQSPLDMHKPPDSFEDASHSQVPPSAKLDEGSDMSSSCRPPPRDQDYRDIDYRTGPRAFDFKPEVLPTPDKVVNKAAAPERFIESASRDQDYRGAVFEDPVSNTVLITGIPKTAAVEQILGAFTTPDGVPIQGMKIKTVVPGYSYDTAIVEFLNLEDAVHIMESNKVAHPHHSARLSLHLETRG